MFGLHQLGQIPPRPKCQGRALNIPILATASGTPFHTLAQLAHSFLAHGSVALQTPLLLGENPRIVQGDLLRFANQVLQFPLFLTAEFPLVVLVHQRIDFVMLVDPEKGTHLISYLINLSCEIRTVPFPGLSRRGDNRRTFPLGPC